MHARRMQAARLLLALLIGSAAVAASAAGSYADEAVEPVPTGAELVERCDQYREELAFTRAQLKARSVLGRWDFLASEHRKREKFVADHCDDAARHDAETAAEAHGDGDHAELGAAARRAPGARSS